MASRSAGTLLSEFNAAYVPPALMPGYQGHVPGVAFAFGSSYGTNTFRYFQDHRNAAMEKNFTCFSRGSSFPTVFSSDRTLEIRGRSHTRDHGLYLPSYTHFNLDSDRSKQLNHFYQAVRQHRKYYRDKTGTVPCVPYFLLPVREQERYPLPTNL